MRFSVESDISVLNALGSGKCTFEEVLGASMMGTGFGVSGRARRRFTSRFPDVMYNNSSFSVSIPGQVATLDTSIMMSYQKSSAN